MFSVFSDYELSNYKHPCIGFCVNMLLFLLGENKKDCWVVWYVYNSIRNAQIASKLAYNFAFLPVMYESFSCSSASSTLCIVSAFFILLILFLSAF